jgi:hypothetical protein
MAICESLLLTCSLGLFIRVTGSLQSTCRILIFTKVFCQHTGGFSDFAFQGAAYRYLAVPFTHASPSYIVTHLTELRVEDQPEK